jgi:ATP-dependent helicase HrpB
MRVPPEPLPIEPVLPALRDALRRPGVAVLQAPPGAGKTTRVPLALLDAEWLGGRRILLLEPRRLAARAAAHRMAGTLGEAVGETVGFRIRHETVVGARTRIEVVTEGILTRMLESDPALESAGLVIFDEFHERSLHADLGLALTLQSRAIVRPDLRVLVMSATLDGQALAGLLGGAPIVTSRGTQYPVETRYRAPRAGARLESSVAAAVREAMADEGDVLAFLPGTGEIRRTEQLLADLPADVLPLHGSLPRERQDQVFRPSPPGRRKVVLATSIAETSLTIDGVRVVVDGGRSRVPRYSPRTGMTRLATVRVSLASADQRRGRAGRQGPGVCYRLWSSAEEMTFVPRSAPEILEADLAPLSLALAAAGVSDPAHLAWLDPPPQGAVAEARRLLVELEALDRDHRITAHGRRLSRYALHPRLAHMVVRGGELGAGDLPCELAALLAERDLLRVQGTADADLSVRLDLLRGTTIRSDVDREALRQARREARSCKAAGQATTRADGPGPGLVLALAYPDRIGRRRPGAPGRFLLRNGQGAWMEPQALAAEDFIVAAELDGSPRESRIYLALALLESELLAHFADDVADEEVVAWDPATASVVAQRRRRLGAIVLEDAPLPHPDPERARQAFLEGVRRIGVQRLPWSAAASGTRSRLAFMHRLDPVWPDVSDDALTMTMERWLGPEIVGVRSIKDLEHKDLGSALLNLVAWNRRAELDEWAPTHVQVPSGSRIKVDYGDPTSPVLAVKLQELFGQTETPRVGGGRVPLTLHLLSPAGRPVQVTRDLAGFWRTAYFDIRKDLKGRYPKHPWPEDPLDAEPTRHAKRRPWGGT